MTESHILVSLEDTKAKKLAEVISNNTSRKILNYLSEKEATPSELSKNLNISITTVNYNIKNLIKTDLIESKEFKYSPKGKEMEIYKIKNKFIIIAPTKGAFKEDLKRLWPIPVIGAITATIIEFSTKKQIPVAITQATQASQEVAKAAADEVAVTATSITTQYSFLGLYFFLGILLSIIIYLIIRRVKK